MNEEDRLTKRSFLKMVRTVLRLMDDLDNLPQYQNEEMRRLQDSLRNKGNWLVWYVTKHKIRQPMRLPKDKTIEEHCEALAQKISPEDLAKMTEDLGNWLAYVDGMHQRFDDTFDAFRDDLERLKSVGSDLAIDVYLKEKEEQS